VDATQRVLRVERAFEPDGTVKSTKAKDHAQVALDAETMARIRAWQVAQRERALAAGVSLVKDPWLLSDDPASARPWRPDLATRRFTRIREAAGVDDTVRLQDLRHANVTFLVASGVDPRTVAGRVGHDPSVSLGTYAAIVNDANRHAADLIAAALDAG
jgi:integrase